MDPGTQASKPGQAKIVSSSPHPVPAWRQHDDVTRLKETHRLPGEVTLWACNSQARPSPQTLLLLRLVCSLLRLVASSFLGTPPPSDSPHPSSQGAPGRWSGALVTQKLLQSSRPSHSHHHLAQGREQAQLARRDPCPQPPPPLARPPQASLGPCLLCTPPAPRQVLHSWLGLAGYTLLCSLAPTFLSL